jgi:hypothetical protein
MKHLEAYNKTVKIHVLHMVLSTYILLLSRVRRQKREGVFFYIFAELYLPPPSGLLLSTIVKRNMLFQLFTERGEGPRGRSYKM